MYTDHESIICSVINKEHEEGHIDCVKKTLFYL